MSARHDPIRTLLARCSLLAAVACLAPMGIGAVLVGDAQAQVWVAIEPTSTPLQERRLHGMIVDEAGNRLVVVGGEYAEDGTWALDLAGPPVWTNLNIPAPAEARDVVQAIYEPATRRMILVMPSLAVYALDLANPTAWTILIEEGTGPAPRRYPAICFDSLRNRLVLFGGGPDTGTYSDVWTLDLTGPPVWNQITSAGVGPSARWGAVAVYDPYNDQLVVGTGLLGETYFNDFWTLSLASASPWVRVVPQGSLLPSARYLSAACFDPVSRQVVLYGGYDGSGQGDTWALHLEAPQQWVQLATDPPIPPRRWSHRVAYHAATARMYTYGGFYETVFRSDVWALALPGATTSPVIVNFNPAGGSIGDVVLINGFNLASPLEVTIGGGVALVLSSNFSTIQALVPPDAVTGPISVTTSTGTAASQTDFIVGERPEVAQAVPDSGRSGDAVTLRGRHFTGATKVTFGGTGSAAFEVASDTVIVATLDTLASTGPVRVTTVIGVGESAFTFQVLPDDPRPRLLSVRDVAGDQGGRVMLRWRASDFDKPRYRSILGYRVWRRAPLEGLGESPAPAAGWRSGRQLGLALSNPSAYWESIAELPAAFLAGYAYTAATLRDSTDQGNPYTAYFVQALTGDPFVFYNSSPDSGYSVDNLAPPTPSPFAVSYGPSANTLHWRGRPVADLHGYRIHRGSEETFLPSLANLVTTTTDTTYADIPGGHYYKLAAVDIHGNLSRYVAASPDRPVATLASFYRAHRERGLARVEWFSGGNPNLTATVYRRAEGTDWAPAGGLSADGRGFLTFEDRAVEDDRRYGYRLGVLEPDGVEEMMGETWIEPLAVPFAFAGRFVNPSPGGRLACTLSLPASTRVELRLFDISGREVERQVLEPGSSGDRTVQFGTARRLRAGVYLLRATTPGAVMHRRAVVLD